MPPPTNECHCLGLSGVGENLRGLMRKYSPNGLFLYETKSNMVSLEKIGRSLNFDNSFFVEANGSKRGSAFSRITIRSGLSSLYPIGSLEF